MMANTNRPITRHPFVISAEIHSDLDFLEALPDLTKAERTGRDQGDRSMKELGPKRT